MSNCGLQPNVALQLFVNCCRDEPASVGVGYDAMVFARSINLKTESDLINFIADGGLEIPLHQNTETHRLNPRKDISTLAYAYGFFSGDRFLYISILHPHYKCKWWIKSFHANKNTPTQMHIALRQAKKQLGKDDET